MIRRKSAAMVSVLMVIAVLFGCQCGGGPGGPGAPGVPGANQPGDPAEKAAVDLVNQHGGSTTAENGKVVTVGVFRDTFTDNELKSLASLTKVRKMNLASTKTTGSGLQGFAGAELADLTVGQGPFNDTGMKEIARFQNLRRLSVQHNKVTDAGFRELAALKQLEELAAEGTSISDAGVTFIANNLKTLKKLNLGNNQIGDLALMALAGMPNLTSLTIYGTRVTDKGLAALPRMNQLEELRLGAGVSDAGMKSVAQCANLRTLFISNANVTDAGLRDLGALSNLKDLQIRNAVFGKVTSQAIQDFIKTHPNCTVKGPN